MTSPRALRHIVRRVEEMTSTPHRNHDAATDWRLGLLRRRAEARVATAAGELAEAARAGDASAELRALAAAVRAGTTTWEQCVAGKADHLPEVRAWLPRPGRKPAPPRRQADYLDEDDEVMLQFLLRRDDRNRDG